MRREATLAIENLVLVSRRNVKFFLYRAGQASRILPNIWMLRSPFKVHEFRQVTSAAGIRPDHVVFDMGCGKGFQTQLLARGCNRVVGLDIGEKQITEAKLFLRNSSVENKVEFVCSKLEHAQLPASSFDRVISFCVLEHIPNLDEVLGELVRVLRPGGEFHASVDALSSIKNKALLARHRKEHHVIQYFTPTTLRERLETSGFQVLEIFSIMTGDFARKKFEERIQLQDYSLSYFERMRVYNRLHEDDLNFNGEDGIMLVVRARRP